MGAAPVAIANMSAVTAKYGPSFKAFLVVLLVGTFFIDLLNALAIKFSIGLPIMHSAASIERGMNMMARHFRLNR